MGIFILIVWYYLMESIMNEMRKDMGLKKARKGKLLGFFVNDIKAVMKK